LDVAHEGLDGWSPIAAAALAAVTFVQEFEELGRLVERQPRELAARRARGPGSGGGARPST